MTNGSSRYARRAAAAIAIALAGCGGSGPAHGPPSPDAAATVELTSTFSFDPHTVRVKTGDIVEWRNTSSFAHTITDDPQKNGKLSSLPAGATGFDSGHLAAGEIFRHTFTVPGTYRYYCDPHDGFGMLGVVIVEPRT
jgi:plastocyanin